jgi:CRP/FNR family transcriptional regulator, cyclic AMP receptor protein
MHKPKRKIVARRRRSRRNKEAARTAEDIRRFDRTEPTPPTNEIQLMTAEERRFMSAQVQTEALAARVMLHPFLAGMNRTQLALLTECAIAAHFKTGETILRQGEFADRCYLIETGKVALESGGGFGEALVIETIGAGDLLGWSWMFPPYTWQFTARAIEPTTAIFFYGRILREHCEKDHSLGYDVLKRISAVMVRRLQAAHNQMLSLYSDRPPVIR